MVKDQTLFFSVIHKLCIVDDPLIANSMINKYFINSLHNIKHSLCIIILFCRTNL